MGTGIFLRTLTVAFCFLAIVGCKTTPPETEPKEATEEITAEEPQTEPLSEVEKYFKVIVGKANIRSEPSMEGEIIAVVKKDATYMVTGQHGNWLKLRLRDGREGWIHHKLVEEVAEQ